MIVSFLSVQILDFYKSTNNVCNDRLIRNVISYKYRIKVLTFALIKLKIYNISFRQKIVVRVLLLLHIYGLIDNQEKKYDICKI